MIRRRGNEPQEDDSSSSEGGDDAFAVLSRKSAKRPRNDSDTFSPADINDTSGNLKTKGKPPKQQKLPISLTSSMKRHHKPSDTRKAKMDALLQELEAEKERNPTQSKRFAPEKQGSYVELGEEHLTTNIFVGNLAPGITEEQLSDLFLQFGEIRFGRALCFVCAWVRVFSRVQFH
jgi:RNA recognition motif-containing protein